MSRIVGLLVLAIMLALSAARSHAAELVMFERAGCVWCARFDAEIAPIYGRTEEGQAAPLRRVDLNRPCLPISPGSILVPSRRASSCYKRAGRSAASAAIRGMPSSSAC